MLYYIVLLYLSHWHVRLPFRNISLSGSYIPEYYQTNLCVASIANSSFFCFSLLSLSQKFLWRHILSLLEKFSQFFLWLWIIYELVIKFWYLGNKNVSIIYGWTLKSIIRLFIILNWAVRSYLRKPIKLLVSWYNCNVQTLRQSWPCSETRHETAEKADTNQIQIYCKYFLSSITANVVQEIL